MIAVACVGRLRGAYREAADEYVKRLSRYTKLDVLEVPDQPERDGDAENAQVMRKEGEALLSRVKPGDRVIALCVDAKQRSSEELAARVKAADERAQRLVFVVGGSLGLSPAVLARADETLSMSRMTFPHQLARVMLLEQLYRACKINAGERYHK